LEKIYREFGIYVETLSSLTKKGKKGAEEIEEMMKDFRSNVPTELGGSKVIELIDYEHSTCTNLLTKETKTINFPKSNVLQFVTEDHSKISLRPSGTEPKIKFYFGVKSKVGKEESIELIKRNLLNKIETIKSQLNIN
jgi:phosphoglucomutase